MQKRIFILFISFVLVYSMACNRKMKAESAGGISALAGSWELREDQSGMIPVRKHPDGNGNRYTFTGSRYERFVDGALENSGTFRVEKDTTAEKEVGLQLPDGEFTHRIIFNDDTTAPKTFFQITGDKLSLLSGYFPTDGGSRYTYQKIANNQ